MWIGGGCRRAEQRDAERRTRQERERGIEGRASDAMETPLRAEAFPLAWVIVGGCRCLEDEGPARWVKPELGAALVRSLLFEAVGKTPTAESLGALVP